mgnify:FL=1
MKESGMSGRPETRRTALHVLILALSLIAATAFSAQAARKLPDFDPFTSLKPDVLAFKTTGKILRVTTSADVVRASFRGFPEVVVNDHGYAERVMIRTPVQTGSISADFSLGCGG